MSAAQKQMYAMMKNEVERLEKELNGEHVVPNEIPSDFNQTGWDLTIQAVENMLEKMKAARDVKGKRLTPQFFRSIFNRTILADADLNKFMSMAKPEDTNIDYGAETIKLTAKLHELNTVKQQRAAASTEETSPKNENTTDTRRGRAGIETNA